MITFKKKILSVAIIALSLTACKSDNKHTTEDASNNPNINNPETNNEAPISSFVITDANNIPITTGTVQIIPTQDEPPSNIPTTNNYKAFVANSSVNSTANKALPTEDQFSNSATYNIKTDGTVDIEALPSGNYYLLVKTQGASVVTFYSIKKGNSLKNGYVNIPVICSTSNNTCENTDNIVGSLTGIVSVDNKPLQNTQVSLSGGSVTNGAFANAITDADGVFVIPFNVASKEEYTKALKNAVLTITPTNYQPLTLNTNIQSGNINGLNIQIENKPKTQGVYWQETFEDSSKTASLWQITNSDKTTGWLVRTSNYAVTNNLVNKQVKLAPNDNTQGLVPLPLQGNKSLWYGNKDTGNFLGIPATFNNNSITNMDGGTSEKPHSGTLTSPSITLPDATTPISLSFKTWWEIESVNPNINGFDVMTVSIATGNSNNFVPIARLNPLTDPQTQENNAPLPFTTGGFNQAPKVIQQENISLDDYKGKTIRIRFTFDTNDHLYNGFRGWMIDDILITDKAGTFPKYDSVFNNDNIFNNNEE